MNFIYSIPVLVVSAAAGDWGQSCTGERLESTTDVLSASCNIGDGKGTFVDTSLNLNDCLGYQDGKIIVRQRPDSNQYRYSQHILT